MTYYEDEQNNFSPKLIKMYRLYCAKPNVYEPMEYAMWLMLYRNAPEKAKEEMRAELRMHEGENLLAMDDTSNAEHKSLG